MKNKNLKFYIIILFQLLLVQFLCFSTPAYTNIDIQIDIELNKLFKEFDEKTPSQYEIIKDGILPKYSQQKVKVLYLYREIVSPNYKQGQNLIDELDKEYQSKQINFKSIDSAADHRKMLRITYGLNNNADWKYIPKASEFNYPDDVSFAIMNLSKLPNETGKWNSDSEQFNKFVNTAQVYFSDFWSREIEIIDPDVIIGMNVNQFGENYKLLGNLQKIEEDANLHITTYWLNLPNGTKKLLIDTYHFLDSHNHKDDKFFYDPIHTIYKKYNGQITRKSIDPIKNIKSTDIFKQGAVEHILLGNSGGGYHYTGMKNSKGKVLRKYSSNNLYGCYRADVEIRGYDKNPKKGNPMFPDDYPSQQIINLIIQAYQTREFVVGNTYDGIAENGMKIRMYLDAKGLIISAFPNPDYL